MGALFRSAWGLKMRKFVAVLLILSGALKTRHRRCDDALVEGRDRPDHVHARPIRRGAAHSIMADFERLRELGVLSLPKQGPAANGAAPAANGNGVVRRQPGAVLP